MKKFIELPLKTTIAMIIAWVGHSIVISTSEWKMILWILGLIVMLEIFTYINKIKD